jgi:hypothetical protein
MHRKYRRRQVRARHIQSQQNQIHQANRPGVLQHIRQVVTPGSFAPHFFFQPEGTVQQRIILLRGPHVEPNAA